MCLLNLLMLIGNATYAGRRLTSHMSIRLDWLGINYNRYT